MLYNTKTDTTTKLAQEDRVFSNEKGLYLYSCNGAYLQTPDGEKIHLEIPEGYFVQFVTDRHVICLTGWFTSKPLGMIVKSLQTGRTVIEGTTQTEAVRVDPTGRRLVAYDPSLNTLRIWDLTEDAPPPPKEIALARKPIWLILGYWSPESTMLVMGIDWTDRQWGELVQNFSTALLDLQDLKIYQVGDRTNSRETQFFRMVKE